MSTAALIERFLAGELAGTEAPDEAAWYGLWCGADLGALPPPIAALHGGLLADRLAWVFVAGYQAAVRSVFPEVPSTGWAAYVATEDKEDPRAHPGTTLRRDGDGWRLNGYKHWVAQSRNVDHLVVTVNDDGDDVRCLLVDRRQSGVDLSHREEPGFLAAMSQGFARFDDVEITADRVLTGDRVRLFGHTEPPFVMLAATGFLLGRLQDADPGLSDDLAALALALAAACQAPPVPRQLLAGLDRSLQQGIERFAAVVDTDALPDWAADRRLLAMYSPRLQRHGGRPEEEGT